MFLEVKRTHLHPEPNNITHADRKKDRHKLPPANMGDDGDDDFPIDVLSQLRQSDIDWDNREALQSRWTPLEKGWRIQVEWKRTPFGLGAFAAQDVTRGTILRVGNSHRNVIIFSSK